MSSIGDTLAEALGMGDVFKLSEHGAPMGPISWVYDAVSGTARYITLAGGELETIHPYTRLFMVRRAPRCECGRRFDRCEMGCEWPAWLEDVYMGRSVDLSAI